MCKCILCAVFVSCRSLRDPLRVGDPAAVFRESARRRCAGRADVCQHLRQSPRRVPCEPSPVSSHGSVQTDRHAQTGHWKRFFQNIKVLFLPLYFVAVFTSSLPGHISV